MQGYQYWCISTYRNIPNAILFQNEFYSCIDLPSAACTANEDVTVLIKT